MHVLLSAELAAAEASDPLAAAKDALARFRTSQAPWWIGKAIRPLEQHGATLGERDERRAIERMLGVAQRTSRVGIAAEAARRGS